jgi:hypothetical protein
MSKKKMTDISYIVASTPRSGTGYAAEVFSAMGMQCGHEKAINPYVKEYSRASEGIWGDASWLAAPFLSNCPKTTVVLHQLRDPVKSLDSMMTRRQIRGKWKPGQESPRGEYTNFLKKYVNDWESDESAQERLVRFWVEWHTLIEESASSRGLRYFRYRIEDINENLLLSIADQVGATVSSEQVEKALSISTRVNHHAGKAKRINPWAAQHLKSNKNAMAERLLSLSAGYGYDQNPSD